MPRGIITSIWLPINCNLIFALLSVEKSYDGKSREQQGHHLLIKHIYFCGSKRQLLTPLHYQHIPGLWDLDPALHSRFVMTLHATIVWLMLDCVRKQRSHLWCYGVSILHWNRADCLLTHWGRATHICVSKVTVIASDNGLSPGRRQAIIWNNAGILSIGLLGTSFSEILIKIHKFSFKKMRLKVSSAKWRPCCLGLNVLTACTQRLSW